MKEEILMKTLDVYMHNAILWQILNQTLSEFFTTGVSRQGNSPEEKTARSGNKEYISGYGERGGMGRRLVVVSEDYPLIYIIPSS